MQSLEKRRNKAQANRQKILKCAISLFQKYGFDNVTIDDIGKEAGFSRGTVYKLFVSKEDLVVSYMVQWNSLYEEYYRNELQSLKETPLEKIRQLTEYMLVTSTRGGQEFQRIAIASGMKDPVLAQRISKSNAPITKILENLLETGQKNGTITNDYPISELTEMIYTVLEGICLRWAGSYTDKPFEECYPSSLNLLIQSLKS